MAKQSYNYMGPNNFGNLQLVYGQTVNPRPYVAQTTYGLITETCEGRGFGYARGIDANFDFDAMFQSQYEKFWKRARQQANLALTLVDHKQSYAMIKHRALQMAAGVMHLSRFNRDPIGAFTRAADAFSKAGNLNRPGGARSRETAVKRIRRGHKRIPKNLSDAWLELQFGWIPLMEDVAACTEVLTKTDFFSPVIRVTKADVRDIKHSETYYSQGRLVGQVDVLAQCTARVRQQGRVIVTNADTALASQLGLLNLPYVIWDAVPMSFVLDWFIPVGRFLANQTLDYGFGIHNGVYSHQNGKSAYARHWFENDTDWLSKARAFAYYRSLGSKLSPPSLRSLTSAHEFRGNAWQAATAAALVTQNWNRLKGLVITS